MASPTQSTNIDPASASAVQLFRYLRDLAELRSATVRSITEYEKVLWLADIPNEPEVFSVTAQETGIRNADDDWIEIRKTLDPLPMHLQYRH